MKPVITPSARTAARDRAQQEAIAQAHQRAAERAAEQQRLDAMPTEVLRERTPQRGGVRITCGTPCGCARVGDAWLCKKKAAWQAMRLRADNQFNDCEAEQ
jgi:hypothetical protein